MKITGEGVCVVPFERMDKPSVLASQKNDRELD